MSAAASNHEPMSKAAAKKLVRDLLTVPGITSGRAEQLIDAGVRDLKDLKKAKYSKMITIRARNALPILSHLQSPVTEAEVDTLTEFIRGALLPEYELTAIGPHRRSDREEIHLLLTNPTDDPFIRPNTTWKFSALKPEISRLLTERGLIHSLIAVTPHRLEAYVRVPQRAESNSNVWESLRTRLDQIASAEGVYRTLRIDFVPSSSKAASLVTFTSDRSFIRRLRNQAQSKQIHFDQFGLWNMNPRDQSADAKPLPPDEWEDIPTDTEEDVFRVLGLDYVKPEDRFITKSNTSSKRSGQDVEEEAAQPKAKRPRGRPKKNAEGEAPKRPPGRPVGTKDASPRH